MSRFSQITSGFGMITALSLIPVVATHAGAEERDPQLEKVFADWQERQHWFEAVEYQVQGRHLVPKGAYTDNLPSIMSHMKPGQINPTTDMEGPINITILLDLKNGRHRREHCEQQFYIQAGKLKPLVLKDFFNGAIEKCLISKADNPKNPSVGVTLPEMTIVSGSMQNGNFQQNFYPIFFAQGRVYTIMEPIIPGKLRNIPDRLYFYIHGTGVYDNRACLVLRTKPFGTDVLSFQEYWVDLARESAIVRFLAYNGTSLDSEISIQYKTVYDHWLPDTWRWVVFSRGKALYEETTQVERIRPDPPITNADFELETTPGILVEQRTDHQTGNPIEIPKSDISVYRLKDNGEKISVPDPYRRQGDQYSPHHTFLRWIWAFWAVVLITALGYFFVWLKRRA